MVFGTVTAFSAPGDWSRFSYPVVVQELSAQPVGLTNTARAPPTTSADITSTGTAFAQTNDLRTLGGTGTRRVVYAFLRSFIAPNTGTAAAGDDANVAYAAAKIETENNAVLVPVLITGALWLIDKGITAYDAWQDIQAVRDGQKTLDQVVQERGEEYVAAVIVGNLGKYGVKAIKAGGKWVVNHADDAVKGTANSGELAAGKVKWVDENAGMSSRVRDYNDSATGARSNPATQSGQAPALERTMPDGSSRLVKFDGLDGDVLVDRKLSVVTTSKAKDQALRQSEVLSQNGLTARWEVPSQAQASRAQKMFDDLGIKNISVKVVNEPGSR